MKLSIYKIKIITLIIFVFSIPFEYWDPFGVRSFFTVSKMTGLLYFGSSLIYGRRSFRIASTFPAVRLLFLLWIWLGLQSTINYWHNTQFTAFDFSFLQNIILFWLMSSDMMRNKHLTKKVLLALVSGVILMSILVGFGIGLEADRTLGEGRLKFFGSNPNEVGSLAAIALIIIISMAMKASEYFKLKTYFLLAAVPSILLIISSTGSRGALFIVIIGLLLFVLTFKTSPWKKAVLIVFGLITSLLIVHTILESDVMQRRVALTSTEGSLGGREEIWSQALEIFYNRPLVGHGITGYEYQMIKNNGYYMDTHNLYLYILVTGGLVGFVIFFLFLRRVFLSAFNSFTVWKHSLMIVLFCIYLFTIFKSGGILNSKAMWVLLALVYAHPFSQIASKQT